jgi:hypothetical protein
MSDPVEITHDPRIELSRRRHGMRTAADDLDRFPDIDPRAAQRRPGRGANASALG